MYLKNLKEFRKQKGWSQERLARESNISYHTLIKLEQNNIKNPKIETVIKLADALEVSLDELVGREGFWHP
jgi:transcriptional regulator with XRE-family HTH domain